MKKVLFYLPAIIYTIAVITLNIILHTFSPLWYAWVVLLLFSGIFLCKGKVWGGIFGLLPAIHLLYMSSQYTGQVIKNVVQSGDHTKMALDPGWVSGNLTNCGGDNAQQKQQQR